MYEFEKKKLKSYLGNHLYNELKLNKAIIAGGAITSIFTRNEINDIDIYFRNNKQMYQFVEENIKHVVSDTKKAVQWMSDNKLIQVITFDYFNNAHEIFDKFDFTVCMGAFDFETEEFVLHEDFMKHNSQRIIKFNSKTDYPIISAIRLDKYQKKGYYLSKSEFMRVILTCMNLKIDTYDELKEHLGGMYGESYDRLFEDVKDDEFSLTDAIEKLKNLSLSDEYFEKYKAIDYNIDEILEKLDKSEKILCKFKNGIYRKLNKKFENFYISLEECNKMENVKFFEGVIDDMKFYKFVNKINDRYYSIYDNSFEYKLNEIVEAKTSNNKYNGNHCRLYFNYENKISKSSFYSRRNNDDVVLIEVELNTKDVLEATYSEIRASKCKMLREVPKEEWINYIENTVELMF